MKPAVSTFVDIVLYLILFMLTQILINGIFSFFPINKALSITLAYGISAVITIFLFRFLEWVKLDMDYIRTRPVKLLLWLAVLSAALILPSQYMNEIFNADMPEDMVNTLKSIIGQPLGYAVIGIIVPIAEEVVFRGAILRRLLFEFRNPWIAIVISAVIFGAVHGNAAQFIHALLVGILLGWVFSRTGSILPGIVIHWVNNSIAFTAYKLFPEKADCKLMEMFNGDSTSMYAAIGISIVVIILSLYMVIRSIERR